MIAYIVLMIVVTNLIRVIPVLVFRGQIRNSFVQSFLFYVPYVTLSVMTFPAIVQATQSPMAGFAALAVGVIVAYFKCGLFVVSIACCVTAFIFDKMHIFFDEWFAVIENMSTFALGIFS